MTPEDLEKYKSEYSDSKLMTKLKRFAKKAGLKVVYMVLLGKELMSSPEVPLQTKVIIAGALGYFIMPIDLIPDLLVGVGYTDDAAALLAAIITAKAYINDDMRERAKEKLHLWFGDFDDEQLEGLI